MSDTITILGTMRDPTTGETYGVAYQYYKHSSSEGNMVEVKYYSLTNPEDPLTDDVIGRGKAMIKWLLESGRPGKPSRIIADSYKYKDEKGATHYGVMARVPGENGLFALYNYEAPERAFSTTRRGKMVFNGIYATKVDPVKTCYIESLITQEEQRVHTISSGSFNLPAPGILAALNR